MKIYVRKGCKVFAVYVMDEKDKHNELKIEDIPILKYFKLIFTEEVPRIPPKREIDFMIDLIQGAVPASKYPYQMNIKELNEVKSQLSELINKTYIRSNVSPWGAPVLFVNKKRWHLKIMHILSTIKEDDY